MRIILCFSILLSLSISLQAQKLKVKSFTPSPMDISASQYERKNSRGEVCALIKLLMVGEIDGVEGSTVGRVENRGTEKWIYMDPGARMLGIIPAGSQNFSVRFDDYGVEHLESKNTYVLTIVADNRIAKTYSVGNVTFDMVKVEGGKFLMGVPKELEMNNPSVGFSSPQHRVTLSSYWIGETEVTQGLWKAVMGNTPIEWKGDDYPMEGATWDECQEFLKRLNAISGNQFRMPTEAEWEFAARGGNESMGYKCSGSNDLTAVAWYSGDGNGNEVHPVKGKKPNELWLYDMNGNVAERCSDWWGYYEAFPQTNPQEAGRAKDKKDSRVLRGGGFTYFIMTDQSDCYVYSRTWVQKKHEKAKERNWLTGVGMRLVLSDNNVKQ